MEYITKQEYVKNRNYYLELIKKMFEGDLNSLANIDEVTRHLDFIFGNEVSNAFLILMIKNNELLAMVNLCEYNNILHEWSVFSLFTNKNYRGQGFGYKVLKHALEKLKNFQCNKLISGIESDNIKSIHLHEKLGFVYADCAWDELANGFPSNHMGFVYDKKNKISEVM